MTVAAVRSPEGADHVEVVFLESARFYRLPKSHPRFTELVALLRRAAAESQVLAVQLASPASDVIEDVSSP
jgi:hypothetical protein